MNNMQDISKVEYVNLNENNYKKYIISIICGIGAAIAFSIGIILRKYEEYNSFIITFSSCSSTIFPLSSLAIFQLWYKKQNIMELFEINGTFSLKQLILCTCLGIVIFENQIFYIYGLKVCCLGHINAGIFDGIGHSSVIYTSIICYYLYKELVNAQQGIGICILILGLSIISIFSNNTEYEQYVNQEQQGNYYLQVIFISQAVGLNISIYLSILKYNYKRNKKPEMLIIYTYFIIFLLGFISLIATLPQRFDLYTEIPFKVYLNVAIGATFHAISHTLMNYSIKNGIASITATLIGTVTIFVTILDYFFNNQSIGFISLMGIMIAFLGGSILSFDKTSKQEQQQQEESDI